MSEPGDATAPAAAEDPVRSKAPAPLVISCVFGIVGLLLIVAGAATSTEGAFLAGMVAGILSLAAALYWRSELVSAWAARKKAERS